jgi:hypothetical protein
LRSSSSKNVKPDKPIDYSDHGKLDKIFGPAKVRSILESEFCKRKGKMIVSSTVPSSLITDSADLDIKSAQTMTWPTKSAELCRRIWMRASAWSNWTSNPLFARQGTGPIEIWNSNAGELLRWFCVPVFHSTCTLPSLARLSKEHFEKLTI